MDKDLAKVKQEIKNITMVDDFESMLSKVMLSKEDKELMRLMYKEEKTINYIADALSLSESAVKKRHKKILIKLGRLF